MKDFRYLNGYVVIYKPDHFSCMKCKNWYGWVYEHNYVLETFYKVTIKDNEVVHHIDLNKNNNHIENLMLMSKKAHCQLHKWLDLGAPGYNQSAYMHIQPNTVNCTRKVCPVCGEVVYYKSRKYCSTTCWTKDRNSIKNCKLKIPKDVLEKEIKVKSMATIAKEYNVSDHTVKKLCANYGIPTRKRGHGIKTS